jgi:hypothetical protein
MMREVRRRGFVEAFLEQGKLTDAQMIKKKKGTATLTGTARAVITLQAQ